MSQTAALLALLGPLGTTEVIVIGVVLLLLFGSRLPEVMRSMGRGINEFKKGLKETESDLNREEPPPRLPERRADAPRSALPHSGSDSSETTGQPPAGRSVNSSSAFQNGVR